jgi:hypothetical protein
MNNQSAIPVIPPFSPKEAWAFWQQLYQLADFLWESYEQEFLQFCIDYCDSHVPVQMSLFD